MKLILLIGCSLILLLSCATTYQPGGLLGGYSDEVGDYTAKRYYDATMIYDSRKNNTLNGYGRIKKVRTTR